MDQDLNKIATTTKPIHELLPIDFMEKLVRRRRYREFNVNFRDLMGLIRRMNIYLFADGDQDYFTRLFELWFTVMEKPAFQFEHGDEILFTYAANIHQLLAVTPHKNGDECIRKISGQPENIAKMLLLYGPRTQLEIPVKSIFDANPNLASMWYSCLWNWTDTFVNPTVQRNYEYFLNNADERFEPFDSDLICGYFRCTYVDNERDRILKRIFCRSVGKYCAGASIRNAPDPKSLAVVSAFWNGEHAVYRAFYPYVEELARKYDLTLVDLTPPGRKKAETKLFKRVCKITATPAKIDVSSIMENNFQLAYFPDVGMSQESLYLANTRIAPIQCMSTGHPVSSASPFMDYFISGGEVETADHPEDNYDERLVLLPGLSVNPLKPQYTPQKPKLDEKFTINVPWMHMKNNCRMAQMLRKLLDKADKPILFSIFPGCGATNNCSYMATIQDYAGHLPQEAFIVHPDLPYNEYMLRQERGRFTIHSYPFGGGTTAADALIIRKPIVVLRGRHEYNRYSAALLLRLGLDDLIADNMDAWLELCTRLVNDSAYLADVTRRVEEADLDDRLFHLRDATGLRRAFDHLIKHDKAIRADTSRKPVVIE